MESKRCTDERKRKRVEKKKDEKGAEKERKGGGQPEEYHCHVKTDNRTGIDDAITGCHRVVKH